MRWCVPRRARTIVRARRVFHLQGELLHMDETSLPRCSWPVAELDVRYHDEEWGVPVHDDRVFFEFLTLEGAQAGLSWSTILKKRNGYREAFAEFDPAKVARFTPAKIERLVGNPAIVRHRQKIASVVGNARAFMIVQRSTAASMRTSGRSSAARRS